MANYSGQAETQQPVTSLCVVMIHQLRWVYFAEPRLKWQDEPLSWMAVFTGKAIVGMVAFAGDSGKCGKGLKAEEKERSFL
ncbi:hypothetical protein CEXT_666011 [Caerostris extrusa]|uniref:Uncharacterized protein n=1 Tax=Caerostris extrusa TaxID=172846 RepID=A0AAV4QLH2_CAEEX|nr:hypothetical protein CEXT_666011 [Caerostris extrusa]